MEEFNQDERLYRMVTNNPNMFVVNENRITSAVFKDSNGCSVDRQGGRTDEDACSFLADSHKDNPYGIKAIAVVTIQQCEEIKAIVLPKPLDTNMYHCEIHRNDSNSELTSGQARRLSQGAHLIYPPFKTNN